MIVSRERLERALAEIHRDRERIARAIDAAGSKENAISYLRLLCMAFGLKLSNEIVNALQRSGL